jgi:hypothetical protein
MARLLGSAVATVVRATQPKISVGDNVWRQQKERGLTYSLRSTSFLFFVLFEVIFVV